MVVDQRSELLSRGPSLTSFVESVWAPRARRRLAPRTWVRDAFIYGKHVRPILGDRPLAALDVEDLVCWQDQLERGGVGDPTIIRAISILSSVFREAARRPRSTGVTDNPVALLERPPAKRRHRPLVWGPVVVERARYQLQVHSRRIGSAKSVMAQRDSVLVGFMEMTGCRPGEALALRWCDIGPRIAIERALSGKEIADCTKTGRDRVVPLLAPLQADLVALRERSGDSAEDFVFSTPDGGHWVETDWRNFRSRHFARALERVEGEWKSWRTRLSHPDRVRESVAGLAATRPASTPLARSKKPELWSGGACSHHDCKSLAAMMPTMRTTVTLDPDVAAKLKEASQQKGISFKEALNTNVRRGLESEEAASKPYRVPTRRLGVRPGVDLDRALRLAAELEDAEIMRKLALRK